MNSITKLCSIYGIGNYTPITKNAAMVALPHQERVAIRLMEENTPGLIVYHGLGSGKTFTAINAAQKQTLQ